MLIRNLDSSAIFVKPFALEDWLMVRAKLTWFVCLCGKWSCWAVCLANKQPLWLSGVMDDPSRPFGWLKPDRNQTGVNVCVNTCQLNLLDFSNQSAECKWNCWIYFCCTINCFGTWFWDIIMSLAKKKKWKPIKTKVDLLFFRCQSALIN